MNPETSQCNSARHLLSSTPQYKAQSESYIFMAYVQAVITKHCTVLA